VPTLDRWDLRPLISNRTLRGSGPRFPRVRVGFAGLRSGRRSHPKRVGFFKLLARIARGGYPYSMRNPTIKWLRSWQRSCATGSPFEAALPRA
jgi:hypothetical protein